MTPPLSARVPTAARYSATAMVLHWLLALVIVTMFVVGVYMTDLPFSPQRLKLYNWHKWAGVTFLALTVWRMVWRVTHRPPTLPITVTRNMPGWQIRAYHATHHLIYLLFFAVPLVGWAYSSAAGFPIVWFGQMPLPDLLPVNKELAELIKPLHKLMALALLALAGLHIAAALKHHLVDRDGLLSRMLPTRS
ncbi:cytochrome b [Rhodoferax sp.]|uniref:cytochrome b n=1 Tax=Rhodoferax sp. TaxID=50421 RepID=UPI0025E5C3FE|nr:cytochrome b [Rhodoferax sp.]